MNEQSNTPETDAKLIEMDMADLELGHKFRELKDFARKLERERDEAIKVRNIADKNHLLVIAERDQLRKVADELAENLARHTDNPYCDLHDKRLDTALTNYNQLPHVIARKNT